MGQEGTKACVADVRLLQSEEIGSPTHGSSLGLGSTLAEPSKGPGSERLGGPLSRNGQTLCATKVSTTIKVSKTLEEALKNNTEDHSVLHMKVGDRVTGIQQSRDFDVMLCSTHQAAQGES
eukprot:848845-Pelagomonas_calceolata.AAC.4